MREGCMRRGMPTKRSVKSPIRPRLFAASGARHVRSLQSHGADSLATALRLPLAVFGRPPITASSHPLIRIRPTDREDLTVSSQSIMITPANTTPAGNSNQTKRAAQTSTQSLNHLLNFSLPPRQAHYPQSIPRRARRTGGNHHVWNKEREYLCPVLLSTLFLTSDLL